MITSEYFPFIPNEVEICDDHLDTLIEGREVVIDMGCGHGDFMIEFAPKRPGALFIGIEVMRKRAHKTGHRLAKRNLTNFHMIAFAGENVLKTLFPSDSVDEIHINFPEPWQRERFWKTRILKPSFIVQTARILKSGGILNFVTDIEKYAKYASESISRFPCFTNLYDQPYLKDIYEKFPTLFYRKMSPLRPINYVSFKRT
jgi:tRNA (guanine-N7-)-methyltransferase